MEQLLDDSRWSSYPVYVGAVPKSPEWLCCERLCHTYELEGSKSVC